MTYKAYGFYELECDCCGTLIHNFDTFDEILDYIKKSNWTSKKNEKEWEHYCEECGGDVLG